MKVFTIKTIKVYPKRISQEITNISTPSMSYWRPYTSESHTKKSHIEITMTTKLFTNCQTQVNFYNWFIT